MLFNKIQFYNKLILGSSSYDLNPNSINQLQSLEALISSYLSFSKTQSFPIPERKRKRLKGFLRSCLKNLKKTKTISSSSYEKLISQENDLLNKIILNISPSTLQLSFENPASSKSSNHSQRVHNEKVSVQKLTSSFQELCSVNGHTGPIFTIKIDSSSKYFYTGSDDGLIKKWSLKNFLLLRNFTGHESEVGDLDISPCGNFIVSCCLGRKIILWSKKGEIIHVLKEVHTSGINFIQFYSVNSSYKNTNRGGTKISNSATEKNSNLLIELVFVSASEKEFYTHHLTLKKISKNSSNTSAFQFSSYKKSNFSSLNNAKDPSSVFTAFSLSADGSLKVFAYPSGEVKLFSNLSPQPASSLQLALKTDEEVVKLEFGPEFSDLYKNYILVITSSGNTYFWDYLNSVLTFIDNTYNSFSEPRKRLKVHKVIFSPNFIFVCANSDYLFFIPLKMLIPKFFSYKVHKEKNIFWGESFLISTFDMKGDILFTGGSDGFLVMWHFHYFSPSTLSPDSPDSPDSYNLNKENKGNKEVKEASSYDF